MKSRLLATAGISVAWMGLDFVIHGKLLANQYAATAQLWRPMAEMCPMIMNGTTILAALAFTLIYCQMVENKTLRKGIKLGILVGLLIGIGSLACYAYMPITKIIALGWFGANFIKFTVAGAIVGSLVKKNLGDKA